MSNGGYQEGVSELPRSTQLSSKRLCKETWPLSNVSLSDTDEARCLQLTPLSWSVNHMVKAQLSNCTAFQMHDLTQTISWEPPRAPVCSDGLVQPAGEVT